MRAFNKIIGDDDEEVFFHCCTFFSFQRFSIHLSRTWSYLAFLRLFSHHVQWSEISWKFQLLRSTSSSSLFSIFYILQPTFFSHEMNKKFIRKREKGKTPSRFCLIYWKIICSSHSSLHSISARRWRERQRTPLKVPPDFWVEKSDFP